MINPIKVIAVIGPTASGKTALAIEIAKKFKGELINTDSRQVYKYIDIGSAKGEVKKVKYSVKTKWDVYSIDNVPIHLINLKTPSSVLTLAEFQGLAFEAINLVNNQNKIPILVGGTGLYIDSIWKPYSIPKVKPDWKLRRKLNKKTIPQLQYNLRSLSKTTFNKLNESDKSNRHRLIRKIEILKNTRLLEGKTNKDKLKILFLEPKCRRKSLYEKINKRVYKIVDQGLIEEVRSLIKRGYRFNTPAMTAISYPIVKDFIKEKITRDELISKFQQGDRNYAKRQMTWFKRYKAKKVTDLNEASKVLKKFF